MAQQPLNPQPDCLDFELLPATPLVPNAGSVRLYADATSGDLAAIKADGTSALPGGVPAGATGDVQFNNGGAFGNADSVAAGCSINLDTFVGSGLSVTIVNGGVTFTSDLDFGVIASAASFECTGGNMQFTTDSGDIDFNSAGTSTIQANSQVQLNAPHVNIPNLQIFANNADAISGGLNQWDLYRSGTDPDIVYIVH